ncbi:MAG: DUF3800 domain-containing protein [Dehalococcoidia bacterium]
MKRLAYCDESGTQSGNRCYGIGAFVLSQGELAVLEEQIAGIYEEHGINYELKWTRFKNYRADIEAACAAINLLLNSGVAFYSIVVEKATFRRWPRHEEEAFYMTYQFLAGHVAKAGPGDFECLIDERSDAYARRPEVMKLITNYRSSRVAGAAELLNVRMVDSKVHRLVQLVDVLVGAVTADTHRTLVGNSPELNPGKEEVIRRLASLIGWDRLHYDTYPNHEFNVWHFPPEFRARPATREVVLKAQRLQQMTSSRVST